MNCNRPARTIPPLIMDILRVNGNRNQPRPPQGSHRSAVSGDKLRRENPQKQAANGWAAQIRRAEFVARLRLPGSVPGPSVAGGEYHPGCYPVWAGGLWLWRTLVLLGFQVVVVPSGLSTTVQPILWITT
jgi:hypothetical protein